MKAESLRVGNILLDFEGNATPIGAVDILAVSQCNIANTPVEFLKEIPITEDWIKSFGFEQSDNWQSSWFFKGGFGINNHGGFWYWNDLAQSVKLYHVHQLQNLYFALTGEELTPNKTDKK